MNEVDKPGSDVEVYVKGLDRVLLKKMQIISDVRERLLNFYSHLKTEEHMSKLYERNQDEANIQNMDAYDYQDEQVVATGNLVDDILNGVH